MLFGNSRDRLLFVVVIHIKTIMMLPNIVER